MWENSERYAHWAAQNCRARQSERGADRAFQCKKINLELTGLLRTVRYVPRQAFSRAQKSICWLLDYMEVGNSPNPWLQWSCDE